MSSEYRPPFPRWRWWVVGAVLAAVLGGIGYAYFDRLAARRVADGVPVDARVTAVRTIPVEHVDPPRLVTVAYRFEGVDRSARLMAALFAEDHRVGEVLTVYVEPEHPQRVATNDGLASEGLVLSVPPAMLFYGIACLVIVGARRARWRWRHERAATGHVPVLEITGMVEVNDSSGRWSRAIERLMATVAAESEGCDADLRMYLVYQVPASVGRQRRRVPRVVWYSRKRRRVTIEARIASAEGADPATEVVRVLEQALHLADSRAPNFGVRAPVPGLGQVVRRTVKTYGSRPYGSED